MCWGPRSEHMQLPGASVLPSQRAAQELAFRGAFRARARIPAVDPLVIVMRLPYLRPRSVASHGLRCFPTCGGYEC